MASSRRVRGALLSDLHVGSTVGLWPEEHRVEGGGVFSANVYQVWLGRCWAHMRAELRRLRPDFVVVNGDVLQGVNARDGQLITNNISVQQSAAVRLLTPIRECTEAMYLIRGTEWHEGKASENIELLGALLDTVVDPSSGQRSWWELYLDLEPERAGGPVAHFAHHVGVSSVPWYEATVPLRDSLLQLSELDRFYGAQAPNLRCVVRSHRHRYIHVDAPPDLNVLVTPGWQLKTAFAHKKAASMLPEIGWVLLEWDGREVTPRSRLYPLPPLHVERVRHAV